MSRKIRLSLNITKKKKKWFLMPKQLAYNLKAFPNLV